jgi:acyl carrier protein
MKITTADIIELACEILQVKSNSIQVSSGIEDTPEWDSITHMSLVLALESRFSVEFTGDEIGELTSISKIYEILSVKVPS